MKRILPILLLLSLLAACTPAPSPRPSDPWTAADLRLLDPAGDAPTPAGDLLAVYLRQAGTDLQLRVDLLDLPADLSASLHVSVQDDGAFAGTPLSFDIGASGMTGSLPVRPRIARDPWLDTITVSFNRSFFGEQVEVAVATLDADGAPVDEAAGLRLDGTPPAASAPLLLAFSDAFPAASPAQALRRWDGAHTGPNGGRHGLRLLLDAARQNNVPLALVDLRTPTSLAVLDSFGGLDTIRAMADAGLLILPGTAWSEPAGAALDASRLAAGAFDLPESPFAYRASGLLQEDAPAQFIPLDDAAHITRSGRTRLIPLPAGDGLEATGDGPTLEVRRALMDAALSDDSSDLVVLGGSLPRSTWGNADASAATLAWIAAHPWIRPLDGEALFDFPVGGEAAPATAVTVAPLPFLSELESAPQNALTDAAWQTYLTLSVPTADPDLQALRRVYAGQVGILLAGSAWAEEPYTAADCAVDLDGDDRPECRLANESYFAVLETNGARLTHLFSVDADGPHQLVGPTAQFQVGIGDASFWDPSAGDAADPGQIMGAFSDADRTFEEYGVVVTETGCLAFSTGDGTRVKTFCLEETGLTVDYATASAIPLSTSLPLVVDPWAFLAGQTYTASLSPSSWQWGPGNGTRVEVRTEADFRAQGFTVSSPFLSRPEDPNLDYPFGHYLPYPLSLLKIDAAGPFQVQIFVPHDSP